MVSPQTLAQNSVVKRIGIPLDTKIIIGSLTTNLWKTEKPQDTTRARQSAGSPLTTSGSVLKSSHPYRTKTRRRPRKQTRLSAQPAAMKATRRQLRSSSERVSDLVSICSFRLACEYSLGAGGVRARLETARWSSLLMLRVDARLSER